MFLMLTCECESGLVRTPPMPRLDARDACCAIDALVVAFCIVADSAPLLMIECMRLT